MKHYENSIMEKCYIAHLYYYGGIRIRSTE